MILQLLEIFIPVLTAVASILCLWNVSLFKSIQSVKQELNDYRLKVSEEYIAKKDLERMLASVESRLEEKLDLLVELFKERGNQ